MALSRLVPPIFLLLGGDPISTELSLDALMAPWTEVADALISFWSWLAVSPLRGLYGPLTSVLVLVMLYNTAFLILIKLALHRPLVKLVPYVIYVVLTVGLFMWRLDAAGIDVGATPSASDFPERGWSYMYWTVVLAVVLIVLLLVVLLVGALRPYAVAANIVLLVVTYLYEGLPWVLEYWGWPVLLGVAVVWGVVGLVGGSGAK